MAAAVHPDQPACSWLAGTGSTDAASSRRRRDAGASNDAGFAVLTLEQILRAGLRSLELPLFVCIFLGSILVVGASCRQRNLITSSYGRGCEREEFTGDVVLRQGARVSLAQRAVYDMACSSKP